MKTELIIDKLLSHEISKRQALELIERNNDSLRSQGALRFQVEEVAFRTKTNDGILKLRLPYQYSKIENKIDKGDFVDVIILP